MTCSNDTIKVMICYVKLLAEKALSNLNKEEEKDIEVMVSTIIQESKEGFKGWLRRLLRRPELSPEAAHKYIDPFWLHFNRAGYQLKRDIFNEILTCTSVDAFSIKEMYLSTKTYNLLLKWQ